MDAPLCAQRNARPAEAVNVPLDGPYADLEAGGQLGGRGPLLPQEDGQDADETVDSLGWFLPKTRAAGQPARPLLCFFPDSLKSQNCRR